MPTMNISLPSELASFVEEEVESGEYGTASEVIRDGLRSLRHAKATREERTAVLRREVGRGIEQARAGKFSRRSVAGIAAVVRGRGGKRA